ncbi:hypothetical protein [Winogradskyella sp.]|uniref:hypothetical protein n=1 Tax=Winogradskyella sp. TaxID=1883156 RepID=UPI003F6C45C1
MTNYPNSLKNNSTQNKKVKLEQVSIGNEAYFKISNSDKMRPFFMSIVSDSNHWMFISSNGGLTAGRKNAEYALFPYYSDDKITESSEITGSKSIFQIKKNGQKYIWEPFSIRFQDRYKVKRNLYKSVYGNSVIFEEENIDLNVVFRYQWCSSNLFGFVKKSKFINNSEQEIEVNILDGIQNCLPYGVSSALQNASSNLVDAYKRTELIEDSGLGIFALSAIIVDKAEPSEALKANIAWSLGFENPTYLLSSLQLDSFRSFENVQQETDVKAEKGAYFVNSKADVLPRNSTDWVIVANVNQDHSGIVEISNKIKENTNLLMKDLNKNISLGTEKLIRLNASSDGLQLTSDNFKDTRHFSNTLFNIMRGGVFDDGYTIEQWDLKKYLFNANTEVAQANIEIIESLPEKFTLEKLKEVANSSSDKDFKRLCLEYMPLKFSRRHGDPSRPWNKFSINTRDEVDGSKILDYEGNWRDIFQNWEALACSYPEFIESMIYKFLNATTFDGYNPYRVTKGGFDWETIEPDDPWSYIGYWGDHQIIYLLKFLEFIEDYKPGSLEGYFNKELFVYADVPYRIKKYQDLLKNPKDTIEFDEKSDHSIRERRDQIGADGALLRYKNGNIVRANFIEKILASTLAKLSNFIPEGGIWMNTQRPEWNDANNALVGNGVSMVTLNYLRRFLKFFENVFENAETKSVEVSEELARFFKSVKETLEQNENKLDRPIDNATRKKILDELGKAGSLYRESVYNKSFSGQKSNLDLDHVKSFTKSALKHLEHSIDANKRNDNLFHAYNLMTVKDNEVSISYLEEMLEGQVAVLSSGHLSSKENLEVLDGLKHSKLFREDQYSYILYPFKNLKGFMDRNTIPSNAVNESELLQKLISDGNAQIIEKDVNGEYHFNGNFKNANDLKEGLEGLNGITYETLAKEELNKIFQIFEDIFNHKAFTGRSGTFYGYEGLGSIYWHMVSKLLLAVMECCQKAIEEDESDEVIGRLLEHYYEINEGIGVHKSPELYGAFPTDPYSHTPAGKGAQQPGMTGQVKEDILSRFGELGVFIKDGQLVFNPAMLRKDEFLSDSKVFNYITVDGNQSELEIETNELVFTFCQVPVIYCVAKDNKAEAIYRDGSTKTYSTLGLDKSTSEAIFSRSGDIEFVKVHIKDSYLK